MADMRATSPLQPHLCVRGGTDAIAFYETAFGATTLFRQLADDGVRVMHAHLSLFGSEIMLHDEFPEFGGDILSPLTRHGASVALAIHLSSPAEVDAAIERAASAGAGIILPASDVFWGARYGRVRDPFGHIWEFNAPLPAREEQPA